jgi:cytochrome c-type biogenesis protein CcmE
MELTPRTLDDDVDAPSVDEPSRPVRRRRRWLPLALLGVVVLVLGFVVLKGLGEATVYFRTADEAVAQRDELGDRRFRMEGTVVAEAVTTDEGVTFDVTHDDVSVTVHHQGDPPEMFRPGQAVVLEGRWDDSGEFFASDRMFVRHDASYESQEDYDERMREAETGGGPSASTGSAG